MRMMSFTTTLIARRSRGSDRDETGMSVTPMSRMENRMNELGYELPPVEINGEFELHVTPT